MKAFYPGQGYILPSSTSQVVSVINVTRFPLFQLGSVILLICGAFYFGYQNLKDYAETALVIEDMTGTWKKHFQQVEAISDPQLEHLSRLVEGFVDYGLRDDFVTHLTVLLIESGEPDKRVADWPQGYKASSDRVPVADRPAQMIQYAEKEVGGGRRALFYPRLPR
jgi:hypothetical protein